MLLGNGYISKKVIVIAETPMELSSAWCTLYSNNLRHVCSKKVALSKIDKK